MATGGGPSAHQGTTREDEDNATRGLYRAAHERLNAGCIATTRGPFDSLVGDLKEKFRTKAGNLVVAIDGHPVPMELADSCLLTEAQLALITRFAVFRFNTPVS